MFGRKRLQRENAALRAALGWYADSTNWRRKGVHAKGAPKKWVKAPTSFDRGARAKFILTQLTEAKHRTWTVVDVPVNRTRADTADTE